MMDEQEAIKQAINEFAAYSENKEDLAAVGELWLANQRLIRRVRFLENQLVRTQNAANVTTEQKTTAETGNGQDHEHGGHVHNHD